MIERRRCLNCEERKDCDQAFRKVGGSYRQAPSSRRCNVCEDCARRLLDSVTPGHRSVNRWDVISLRGVVERFRLDAARRSSQLHQSGVVSSPMTTDQADDGPTVLNVQQAAKELGVSKATLIRKIQTRQIRATKLPGKTGAFVIAAVDLAPHRPPVSRCDRHRWATNGSDSCPRCHSEAQRS